MHRHNPTIQAIKMLPAARNCHLSMTVWWKLSISQGRYKMHKCLVTKLWLLADSFQVSIRLISDFIHIKHSSGKARLPFQTKLCCYTEASHHARQYNTAQATSPFSKGFLFSLFTSPMYPEAPFPLLLPCSPQQSPTRSSPDTRQMVFFSF